MAIHRHSYPEFTDRHGSGPFFLPCKSDAIVRPAPEKQQHQQQSIKKRRMTPTTPQTVVFSKNPCFFFTVFSSTCSTLFLLGCQHLDCVLPLLFLLWCPFCRIPAPTETITRNGQSPTPPHRHKRAPDFFLKHEIITSESGSLLPTVPSGRTQSCS